MVDDSSDGLVLLARKFTKQQSTVTDEWRLVGHITICDEQEAVCATQKGIVERIVYWSTSTE